MITLKGIIDLNFEKAPDVALRLGDTMREAEFELAQDIDLSNCTVSVFVVKPDSTFVITTGTITEDGKIVIAWSDQVAAVKGLGEYCIRISDNNDGYVFSARGKIWIDDHVITDDMIESVAEVNGYTFPDDFATIGDIPEIIPNVEEEATEILSTLKINGVVYSIPAGGGILSIARSINNLNI